MFDGEALVWPGVKDAPRKSPAARLHSKLAYASIALDLVATFCLPASRLNDGYGGRKSRSECEDE
jgi:hypothetical protein